ncbi:MAG: DUF418 domain-containing protein [Sphingopyxis sp.]
MNNPAPSPRISGLDVTRGFAVMGILAMNIIAFAMPQTAYITPVNWGGDSGADLAIWTVNYVLIDSKMRGLFSMLFGASTLLVIQSAAAAGRSPARTHFARMAVLALFGLLHYYLIWSGDILFLYAAVGLLLYLFRDLAVRPLVIWGTGLIAMNTLLMGAVVTSLALGGASDAPSELVEARTKFETDFAYHSAASAQEVALHRSSYTAIVADKSGQKKRFTPMASALQFGMETLGLMLIGMALFKSGLLGGTWSLGRLARWQNRCLGIGIIANIGLLYTQISGGMEPLTLLAATLVYSVPFDVMMSVGYAALFMGLAQRFATAPIIARIAAAGRAAFTNYLGTSLLMTGIFYGYGLGLFGNVTRAACYAFVIAAWALMLLWSKPWLERFHYGPLEWLWRSLARWRVQPLARRQ